MHGLSRTRSILFARFPLRGRWQMGFAKYQLRPMLQFLATDLTACSCCGRCRNFNGCECGSGAKPSNHCSSLCSKRQGCVPTMAAVPCLPDAPCAHGWADSHWPSYRPPHPKAELGIILAFDHQLPDQAGQSVQPDPVLGCKDWAHQVQIWPCHAHTKMARLLTLIALAWPLALHEAVCRDCFLTSGL